MTSRTNAFSRLVSATMLSLTLGMGMAGTAVAEQSIYTEEVELRSSHYGHQQARQQYASHNQHRKHHQKKHRKHKKQRNNSRGLAKVISVKPLYRTVRVSTPTRECYEAPVTHSRSYGGHGDSYTPLIVGGILGGVVGNQFGGGSGKGLLTAAGAILGGSLGRDTQRHHRSHRGHRETYTTYETRCETHYQSHHEERIDGYKVKYKYHGRVYRTTTDYHPGDYIEVDVNVRPIG